MKKFKQYLDEKGRCWTGYKPVPGKKAFSKDSCVKEEEIDEKVKQPTGDLKSACWKGYTAVGTKEKNGRSVPNCVPVEESKLNPADTHKDYAAKSKVLQDLSRNKDVDQKAVQQRRLDLDKEHSRLKEDGAMGGSAGPTNAVGGGAIAGTGGKGGEPGVYLKKKKDNTPIMMNVRRKAPQ